MDERVGRSKADDVSDQTGRVEVEADVTAMCVPPGERYEHRNEDARAAPE